MLGKIKNITIEENILMVNYTRKDAEIALAEFITEVNRGLVP